MRPAGRSRAAQAAALVAAGRVEEAYRLLDSADAGDDPDALIALAYMRLAGDVIRRDLEEARRLFGLAADLGHAAAEPIYTAMLANGAGSRRRWDDALRRLEARAPSDAVAHGEIALIRAMDLAPDGEPGPTPPAETIGRSPRITAFRGLLTSAECRYLIDVARPLLQPSVVVHPATGRLVQDPIRTSAAAIFPFVLETPAIHAINRRLAKASATAAAQGEPLQILCYGPGQEYKPHSDALPAADNQRVLTLLAYLNDDYDGGETLFLSSGVKVRGRVGDAILFANVSADGAPDAAARHAGLPVMRGEKLILSRWIRAKPLDLTGPPDRPF